MRKILFAATLFAFALAQANAADKTVKKLEEGFEITFPDDWDEVKNELPLPFFQIQHGKQDVSIRTTSLSVMRFTDPFEKNREAYVDQITKDDIRSRDKSLILENKEQKIGALTFQKITYQYVSKRTKRSVKHVDYYLFEKDRAFAIKTMAFEDDYTAVAKQIDAIVASFKLLKQE